MTNAREKPRDKQSVTVHEKSRKAEPFNVYWKRAMKLIFSYSLFQTQLLWWWDSSSILPFLSHSSGLFSYARFNTYVQETLLIHIEHSTATASYVPAKLKPSIKANKLQAFSSESLYYMHNTHETTIKLFLFTRENKIMLHCNKLRRNFAASFPNVVTCNTTGMHVMTSFEQVYDDTLCMSCRRSKCEVNNNSNESIIIQMKNALYNYETNSCEFFLREIVELQFRFRKIHLFSLTY